MNNFVKYKHHLLAKNSEAYSLLSAAERARPEDRKQLLRKLDQHLKEVDRQARELVERYA
jgi:hypothetical protein